MATNSLNRLEPAYYRVTITGAVDNESPEQFSGGLPATLAASLLIERSNMRYEAVVRSASEDIQPLQTSAIIVSGRDADEVATSIDLTLVYDRPEYLSTEDETDPGTILTNVAAVTRYVARGLVRDEILNRQIFNPETPDDGNAPQILEVTAVKLYADVGTAEGQITVTEISNLVD